MNPVLVTGSTDGIGLAAVTLLAADKHPVIVQGRDPAKGRRPSQRFAHGTRVSRSTWSPPTSATPKRSPRSG